MWPSLPVANHIADWANTFFIGSLVVGVVSTVLIVWMSNVKEAYWERSRQDSEERIAVVAAQGDQARAELGVAQADIAKANERALQIQLLLNAEIKKNAWRRLTKDQHDGISAAVSRVTPVKMTVAFDGNDPEASVFAADLIKSLQHGGAIVNPQPSAVFVGQMPLFGLVFQVRPDFDAGGIESAISGVAPVEKNESLKSLPAQNRADIFLYVGHKPQAF